MLLNWDHGGWLGPCVGYHGLLFRTLSHNVYIPDHVDYDSGDIYPDPSTGLTTSMPYSKGGEILVKIPDKEAFQRH